MSTVKRIFFSRMVKLSVRSIEKTTRLCANRRAADPDRRNFSEKVGGEESESTSSKLDEMGMVPHGVRVGHSTIRPSSPEPQVGSRYPTCETKETSISRAGLPCSIHYFAISPAMTINPTYLAQRTRSCTSLSVSDPAIAW